MALLTPTIIAKEALIALENETVLAGLVHRTYSNEFHSVGATIMVRKPTTFSSTAVSDTVNMGTASESSVLVALDKNLDVTFEVSTKELSLDIVDFSEQLIQPAMRAHAQTIDAYLAALYVDVAAHGTSTGTAVIGDVTNIRKVLNINKVPMKDRRLVFHPTTEAQYLGLDAFLHASKRGDGGKALRDGEIGRVLGFDCYMDQNIDTHTTGGAVAATATIIMVDAATVGGTQIKLSGMVATGTVNAGDIFKALAYDEWKVVTTAATCTSGSATVTVQPPFVTACVVSSTVSFQQTHIASLAFHKNAFAMVTAPLAPPIGGSKAGILNYKGFSCRVVYDYTPMTKKNLISIDMLCGFKTLDRDLAARFTDY